MDLALKKLLVRCVSICTFVPVKASKLSIEHEMDLALKKLRVRCVSICTVVPVKSSKQSIEHEMDLALKKLRVRCVSICTFVPVKASKVSTCGSSVSKSLNEIGDPSRSLKRLRVKCTVGRGGGGGDE
jgi:SUMO ligase MMS21 Smc5/6 complex component